jgi:hypothetical protein
MEGHALLLGFQVDFADEEKSGFRTNHSKFEKHDFEPRHRLSKQPQGLFFLLNLLRWCDGGVCPNRSSWGGLVALVPL